MKSIHSIVVNITVLQRIIPLMVFLFILIHSAPGISGTPASSTAMMDHGKHIMPTQAITEKKQISEYVAIHFPNVTLVNEEGQTIAVFDELINNKVVVINTIFTTCTTVCPLMGFQFSRLQKSLRDTFSAEDIAENIVLISISIDPGVDTPQRLASWKKKFDGGTGWTLLTGHQSEVDKLLKAAGIFTADPEGHTPITLVGSAKKNQWIRVSGIGSSKKLVQLVSQFL